MDKFADLMVKDTQNGECFRLDHLIKAHLEKVRKAIFVDGQRFLLLCLRPTSIYRKQVMSDKKCEQSVKDNCDQIITRLDGMNKDEMSGVLKVLSIMKISKSRF